MSGQFNAVLNNSKIRATLYRLWASGRGGGGGGRDRDRETERERERDLGKKSNKLTST